MSPIEWVMLAIIASPLLILARDACNRRDRPRDLWLVLGVLVAIGVNIAVTIRLGH